MVNIPNLLIKFFFFQSKDGSREYYKYHCAPLYFIQMATEATGVPLLNWLIGSSLECQLRPS